MAALWEFRGETVAVFVIGEEPVQLLRKPVAQIPEVPEAAVWNKQHLGV